MKILMLNNAVGMADGIHSKEYKQGETYELPDNLANSFIVMQVAKLVDDEVIEEKAVPDAPKNKAKVKAPKNKSELGD
ncbi:MAG TPA: hypothetical protein VJ279_02210 [Hanamia sp.]|jgi:hypothetical protein|nr:hypothetical protein [Hanamia sp.]